MLKQLKMFTLVIIFNNNEIHYAFEDLEEAERLVKNCPKEFFYVKSADNKIFYGEN